MPIRNVISRGFGNGTYSPGVNELPTRGYGQVPAAIPTVAGLEYRTSANRLHYGLERNRLHQSSRYDRLHAELDRNRLHYDLNGNRIHFEAEDDD